MERIGNDLAGGVWVRPQGMGAGGRDQMQAAWFRLAFTLPERPEQAAFTLSAADRFRLYVNGQPAVDGPLKGDRWNHYRETLELAPLLRQGNNVLTVFVVSYAQAETFSPQAAPLSVWVSPTGLAFIAQGKVRCAGAEASLSTGEADWRAVPDTSFCLDNEGAAYVGATETVRLDRRPQGWAEAGNVDWPPVQALFTAGINRYGEFSPLPLKARPIPPLAREPGRFVREMPLREGEPAGSFTGGQLVVPPGETRVVELDAGEETTAYLNLWCQGQGGKITLSYAERYFPADPSAPTGPALRDDWEQGRIVGQKDVIYSSPQGQTWRNFWYRTFRFVRIEAEAGAQPLALRLPSLDSTGYPLCVRAGFTFPKGWMEKLWSLAVRTLARCMHETHEDCPYYEQLQYILDTRLQMLFTYAISGDTRMARKVLWEYHCSQLPDGLLQSRYPCTRTQVIPAFSLHWIFMLEEYIWQTGDAALIKRYRPTMDGVLDYFDRHLGEDGLVRHLGYWDFADWVEKWDGAAGVPDASVLGLPSTVHNLGYALGLQSAARVLRLCGGREEMAKEYEARARDVLRAVRRHCLDAERGMVKEGPGFAQYSQHAQALAVLTGLFAGEEAARALEAALCGKDVLPCTFPWQYPLLRALEKAGLYGKAASIWPQYTGMLDRHLTTIAERPGDTRSDCHAWSALPLYEFVRMNLGVQPAAPGFARIRIAPQPLDLPELEGSAPTPKGPVHVHWTNGPDGFRLQADAPAVPVEVCLPDGRRACFAAGGHIEM